MLIKLVASSLPALCGIDLQKVLHVVLGQFSDPPSSLLLKTADTTLKMRSSDIAARVSSAQEALMNWA